MFPRIFTSTQTVYSRGKLLPYGTSFHRTIRLVDNINQGGRRYDAGTWIKLSASACRPFQRTCNIRLSRLEQKSRESLRSALVFLASSARSRAELAVEREIVQRSPLQQYSPPQTFPAALDSKGPSVWATIRHNVVSDPLPYDLVLKRRQHACTESPLQARREPPPHFWRPLSRCQRSIGGEVFSLSSSGSPGNSGTLEAVLRVPLERRREDPSRS